jgi:DNA-binding beta-propeller fold protein YncE
MPPAAAEPSVETGTPTIFWLDITGGRVSRANADGSGAMLFASGAPLSGPDGITVDPVDGHVFVLNMGSVIGGANNASLVRYKLDGSGAEVIIPPGTQVGGETFNTGKQVTMDRVNRKLYMGDREGSKVWRSDMDGSNLEVLVSGHGIQQIVGVAADPTMNHFYFSDRNGKKLFRAPMQLKDGQTHADRDDLELLYVDPAGNAMPLDLELDLESRTIYWTDRQQDPVFAMGMDLPAGEDAMTRGDVKTVAMGLNDVIGLGFDHQEGMLYATYSGSVARFKTDGSGMERIGSNGTTGIAFVRIP